MANEGTNHSDERKRRARTADSAPPSPPVPPKEVDPKSIPIGMLGVGFAWLAASILGLYILPDITKVATIFTLAFAFLFFRAAYKTRRWGRESATPSDDLR